MYERKCKSCGKTGHPLTLFGAAIGNYCHACYLPIWEKARGIITPKLLALRDSAERAVASGLRSRDHTDAP